MIISSLCVLFLSLVQGVDYTFGNLGYERLDNNETKQHSDDPIFKVTHSDSSNYDDTGDYKKPGITWRSVVNKVLPSSGNRNRNKSFNGLLSSDDDYSQSNMTDGEGLNFIYKPFVPLGDKLKKSKSWPGLLKKVLPRTFSYKNKPPMSEQDSLKNQLLDDYDGEKDELLRQYEAKHRSTAIILKNKKQLPVIPEIRIEEFFLCSETIVADRDDGQSPSCSLACLYYRIKLSIYVVKPQGYCEIMQMNVKAHSPTIVDRPCICDDGLLSQGQFRAKIVQREAVLYSVHNKDLNLHTRLGTAAEIYAYIEENFRQYLKKFLKIERDIPWKEMYDYVLTLRWIRQPYDNRTVKKYLSDILMDEVYKIQIFWITLPERMLKMGKNYTTNY